MAVSAFKSSSRRTNPTNPSPSSSSSSSSAAAARTGRPSAAEKTATSAATRRSRSVSAFSRCAGSSSGGHAGASPSSAEDFLNKRDNPLFWSNASPPDPETAAADSTKKRVSTAGSTDGGGDDGRRGRSVARNDGGLGSAGGRKEVGRSLSRVDTGRRNRSLSRCPVSRGRFVNSESEAEQECSSVVTKNRRGLSMEVDSDDQDERDLVRNGSGFDAVDQTKGLRRWSTQHSASEPPRDSALDLSRSDPATSSLFGVEEKTIKAVCEQMKSSIRGDPLEGDAHGAATGIYETVRSEVRRAISEIQNDLERAIGRSNSSAIANANIIDIPPDLVNPSAVELVLDIRREYAKKLEQSQERARKLRADLAVEEHRGLELSRILKEVLPDPKTPSVQKSRPVRKASMERRKMSKRLTEEAMAYFDECVSLSTFDSSDFSSQEDPPLNIVGTTTPVANYVLSLHASSGSLDTTSSNSYFKDKQQHSSTQDQMSNIRDAAELMASTSYNEPHLDQFSPTNINAAWDWKSPFSFARKPTKTPYIQQDIQKYIKDSEKGIERSNINLHFVRSKEYDLGEYHSHAAAQSFVFDRVVMRNGIESGNLLLCSGGVSVSFSPFASFF